MNLRLIRNATLRLDYAGQRLLLDPFLADQHSLPSFAGISDNPTVDLPIPAAAVIEGATAVIVSHLHSDHFDPTAQQMLSKSLPLYCQPGDGDTIRGMGFDNVTEIAPSVAFNGITITRIEGQHGPPEVLADMGQVSGFVLKADGEATVYWAGDTIWYGPVEQAIRDHQPAVIITHSSGAFWAGQGPIVMDAAQTIATCQAAPDATVIAVHMDALDHGRVSREDLQHAAQEAGVANLRIPADGEILNG